jgi:RHS repeat-associated protein
MMFEQINNTTGTVTYLHHDQAGSTRLLTGSAGTVTGKCTYSAYGTPTCEGTATTPLGYDAQYTSSDTGLIYMRARVYDPATAQFLTVDPLEKLTRAPYTYARDNPINEDDPSGRISTGLCHELEEQQRREEKEAEELIRRELRNCGRVEASYDASSSCGGPSEGEGPQSDLPDVPTPDLPPPGGEPGVGGLKVPTFPFPEPPGEPVPVA